MIVPKVINLVGRAERMMHSWGIRPRRKKIMAPERPYSQVRTEGEARRSRKR
ncbi:MAG: hypothetical protein U5Q44_10940 [Dehalococcoidia bacterium]|nr:hypothetical protein [Dehalococcoidia bacterium]